MPQSSNRLSYDLPTFATLRAARTARLKVVAQRKPVCPWRLLTQTAMLLLSFVAAQTVVATTTNLIHVTTTVQGDSRGQGTAGAPLCSLAEAIYAADTHTNEALDASGLLYTTGCETGTGNDTIVLSDAMYSMTDFVHAIQHSRYGPTATPVIFSNITIQGNGATIQRAAGSPNMRAFTVGTDQVDLNPGGTPNVVSGWGSLTLQNVTIQGFTVNGGNAGGFGGGGGMGAGGAIYVDGSGSNSVGLTVVNSTFTGNGATGGNGGAGGVRSPFTNPGGGGGGLTGNGGKGTVNGTGGGGGGGGSFGDGGDGDFNGDGGGGGGTDSSGQPGTGSMGGGAGFCGGPGGTQTSTGSSNNGGDASCDGGGGGGGSALASGGSGRYGGGGGGAGVQHNNGGNGDFGGGGGAGAACFNCGLLDATTNSGKGGFGGGGGGGDDSNFLHHGVGGRFGGDGNAGSSSMSPGGGGGGAALGGAIFSDSSTVVIQNSTFFNNFVTRGNGGSGADNGADAGGAIFTRNGTLTVQDATISGNQGTGSGAGIVVINDGSSASFTLQNTIIAGNGAQECLFQGSVTISGTGNLIQNNFGCPGAKVVGLDPNLASLNLNAPGNTPTMALQAGSPALNAADAGTSLETDQRGVQRKSTPDIGAYETPAPSADLSITKAVSAAAAVPGDTVTYTLVVTNKGPNDASSVGVSDALPSQLTFVSCSESTGSGTCTFGGGTVAVNYTTFANGASSTITINTTLNSGATDGLTVVNTANVSATSPPDPNAGDNTATANFTVHNRADLAVTKTVSTASPFSPQVEVGDPLTYTVTLTNKGPYDTRGVSLTDSAPSGVTFTGCTSTVGTCVWSAAGASLSLNALTNGSTVTLTIQATLNFGVADGSTVTNTASATSTTFDPNLSNNSGSASFTALNNSDLYVFQSATKLANRQLMYRVNVKNLGKYPAKQLLLTDGGPSGSHFVSITPGPWKCSAPPVGSAGTISCTLPTEAVGTTQTITFVVKVTTPGNVLVNNTASVSEATNDPTLADNTSTLSSKVGP